MYTCVYKLTIYIYVKYLSYLLKPDNSDLFINYSFFKDNVRIVRYFRNSIFIFLNSEISRVFNIYLEYYILISKHNIINVYNNYN